ncbi:10539_t:CDS:2, partial [Entrophospora sp. SA101]
GSKGTKHGYDAEEEGDNEYNADQTVVGGKSTDWVINGIRFWSFMDVYWEILGLHLRMISQFLAESPSIGIQLPGLWYTTTRPTFWEDTDNPSLRKFFDFRHLEGDLVDSVTEHYHYQCELNTISEYYTEKSEVGQIVLKLKSDFKVIIFNGSFFFSWKARTTLQLMGNPNYNGSPPPSNDLSIVQEKQISSYTSYERSETQTDN